MVDVPDNTSLFLEAWQVGGKEFNSIHVFYCYDNHLKFYTKKYIRLRLNDYCSIIFSIPSQRLFNKIHSTFLREIVNYYTCSFLEDFKEETVRLLFTPLSFWTPLTCKIIFIMHIFVSGVDINQCQTSNLCKNGRQCENTAGSYECKCTLGFAGRNCETGWLLIIGKTWAARYSSRFMSTWFRSWIKR